MTRLVVGRDLQVVAETEAGIEMQGRARLRPGREVEVARASADGADMMRRASVESWRVVRADSSGVVFQGWCQWLE